MMRRSAQVFFPLLTAALAATAGPRAVGTAGGSVISSVKATGLSSNADAVVYLQQVAGTFAPTTMKMDQRKMQFTPHVLPVVIGTTVRFLNSDPTPHNVFTPDYEKFNLGTWPQGQTKDHAFAACAKFPCVYTLLCRVHAEMEGFIVVLQNPYFGVSTKEGRCVIENVPAGQYNVGIWHPKLKGKAQPVTVGATGSATLDFTLVK